MNRTRLCKELGTNYPIIQAPMAWVATAELAAAVSEAGGLGTIGYNAGKTKQAQAEDIDASDRCLREQIRRARRLTRKPFAVNILVGLGKQRVITDRLAQIVVEEKVATAIVSMGTSKAYTKTLKESGIKVLHVVASVEQAVKAEADGVDAVICIGYEAGGHLGHEQLPTLVLVPQIADAVRVPVIAGGGIGDARGVVAALALGAEGVYLGTRFLATQECNTPLKVKQAVINANSTSTVVFAKKTGLSRCLANEYTQRHIEIESRGGLFEELRSFERATSSQWHRVPLALVAGDVENGALAMGVVAGMIREILPAGEVVHRLVQGYTDLINMFQTT